MISYFNRLDDLKVADAMSRKVIVVTGNSTMAEAADTLSESQITGAPVVDEWGRCIGILSGSDFIHYKAEELEAAAQRHVLSNQDPQGRFHIDEVRHDLVRSHMTTAVQTISANCPLTTAARCMCTQHIHRLVVVDEDAKPIGVITSLDLVATLVAIVEE